MSNYPPPPPPPAQPVSNPGGAVSGAQNGAGLTALITGIVSLIICIPLWFVMPILAIVFGRMGKKRAAQGLATNGGMATVGFILGIIALVIQVGLGIIIIVSIATGHGSFSASTGGS